MPTTPFIGVRISWLITARNSDLARLACSARSMLATISRSARSRKSSISDNSASRAASATSERWRRASWRASSAVKAMTSSDTIAAAPIRRERLASYSAKRSLSESPTPTISG